jgi:N-glycosylase/DNA lyase
MPHLPEYLINSYEELRPSIRERLNDFALVPPEKYFYEMCYCICTPQSKARSAARVQEYLESHDFYNNPFDPAPVLRRPENYIRFHNQKAERLLRARDQYSEIESMLLSEFSPPEKRIWLADNFKGMGMKESSHFLRNIGYRGLGILDRHVLKHLVGCELFRTIPQISSPKKYLEIENHFHRFAVNIGINIDELDILFWSWETGEILK